MVKCSVTDNGVTSLRQSTQKFENSGSVSQFSILVLKPEIQAADFLLETFIVSTDCVSEPRSHPILFIKMD